jgi:hypothetical protein
VVYYKGEIYGKVEWYVFTVEKTCGRFEGFAGLYEVEICYVM